MGLRTFSCTSYASGASPSARLLSAGESQPSLAFGLASLNQRMLRINQENRNVLLRTMSLEMQQSLESTLFRR